MLRSPLVLAPLSADVVHTLGLIDMQQCTGRPVSVFTTLAVLSTCQGDIMCSTNLVVGATVTIVESSQREETWLISRVPLMLLKNSADRGHQSLLTRCHTGSHKQLVLRLVMLLS